MLKLNTLYSSHSNHHRLPHEFVSHQSPPTTQKRLQSLPPLYHRLPKPASCLHHHSVTSSGFEIPKPPQLTTNRRSLLSLFSALSLPPVLNVSAVTPGTSPPTPVPQPPTQPAVDTTITDRVFLDFSICPTYFRSDRAQPQGQAQAQTQGLDFTPCPDAEPMGRVVLGLYGKVVPTTVSNFKAMCTGKSGASYKNTVVHKILPGQFFVAGRQGSGSGREKGEIAPPLTLAKNSETVESRAFMLEHSRPGLISLCLSENDDDAEAKLDLDYHNVEFLITTGPGPCPQLDGRNIVFGTVLEGLDVITSIAAVPTYKPGERIRQLNDLAEFFGDERAQNARTLWNRPLKSIYISDCGVLHRKSSPYDQFRKDDKLESSVQQVLPNTTCAKPVLVPEVSLTQSAASHDDPKPVCVNYNVPTPVSPSIWTANSQDSAKSLLSNLDPIYLRQASDFLPPRPCKITEKNEVPGLRIPDLDTQVADKGNQNLQEDLLSGNLTMDFCSDQILSTHGSSEDLIKQELQAIAEGVAASVLQSAGNSYASNTSACDANHVSATETKSSSSKFEDVNAQQEKANHGFPLADGLGCLQIIKNSDLEELRELGSGTYGTVYHGKWRGTDVAIKRINDRCFAGKLSEQERMREDFWNEAIKLADMHHPNVVAFYGIVLDGPRGSVATVTEYMVNGSLLTALRKNWRSFDKGKHVLIAMDVAFGMEYMHSRNIVHFDLKSDNLLVNLRDPNRPICKVGDLGLSKVKCQTLISGGVRGTLPWMAPELLNGSSSLVSDKVDVFSFGIVMWELITGEEPYADLHYGAIIGGIVSNTLRPSLPDTCDQDWKSLMERCWSSEPSERPCFTEIASELRSMAVKLP